MAQRQPPHSGTHQRLYGQTQAPDGGEEAHDQLSPHHLRLLRTEAGRHRPALHAPRLYRGQDDGGAKPPARPSAHLRASEQPSPGRRCPAPLHLCRHGAHAGVQQPESALRARTAHAHPSPHHRRRSHQRRVGTDDQAPAQCRMEHLWHDRDPVAHRPAPPQRS